MKFVAVSLSACAAAVLAWWLVHDHVARRADAPQNLTVVQGSTANVSANISASPPFRTETGDNERPEGDLSDPASLPDRFAAEPRDPAWANRMEDQLAVRLERGPLGKNIGRATVRCSRTLCQTTREVAPYTPLQQANAALAAVEKQASIVAHEEGFVPETVTLAGASRGGTSGLRIVTYYARTGNRASEPVER